MQSAISKTPAYPLQFDPIFQYRLWGGRGLKNWVAGPFPSSSNIGEVWLLSDRADNPSIVADGPLKGYSLAEIMEEAADMLMGDAAPRFKRFPLLLKYLDVEKMLSVQVHPADKDIDLIPPGETGKTEAWLILEAKPKSRVFAGLKPDVTKTELRKISLSTVDKLLHSFTPHAGECIPIEAGMPHSLGNGITVLEVQQNSDITFRLYDWDHLDPQTGLPRPLQIEQALRCLIMDHKPVRPRRPTVEISGAVMRERLIANSYFEMVRVQSSESFDLGSKSGPTIVFCVDGSCNIKHYATQSQLARGSLFLLPAALGKCRVLQDLPLTLIEITVAPVRN